MCNKIKMYVCDRKVRQTILHVHPNCSDIHVRVLLETYVYRYAANNNYEPWPQHIGVKVHELAIGSKKNRHIMSGYSYEEYFDGIKQLVQEAERQYGVANVTYTDYILESFEICIATCVNVQTCYLLQWLLNLKSTDPL